MKINDNPAYKNILENIIYNEKSKDLFDAISIIDKKKTPSGSKVIDSYFNIEVVDKKFKINYMLNLEGLIFKGFITVQSNGEILKFGKNIEDRIEDLPF